VEDRKVKCVIVVKVYEGDKPEISFEGDMNGAELQLVWKFLVKGYRLWKAERFKQEELKRKQKEVQDARTTGPTNTTTAKRAELGAVEGRVGAVEEHSEKLAGSESTAGGEVK